MNEQLLIQILDLLAEAEISYTANGHSYEPEILQEMRTLSDRVDRLIERLKEAYVIIETKKILEDLPIRELKDIAKSREDVTVKELFDRVDIGEFICPGGPLTNNVTYLTLKSIFEKNYDITIEEATRRMSNRK